MLSFSHIIPVTFRGSEQDLHFTPQPFLFIDLNISVSTRYEATFISTTLKESLHRCALYAESNEFKKLEITNGNPTLESFQKVNYIDLYQ